ncbi:MAG: hypothetical protein R3E39_18500 [Anaerolineae bacterium]
MVKTYTFKVALADDKDCWRKIEMTTGQTLEQLHHAIQKAFAFDDDHLYSFFMSGKAWDAASQYSIPEDETSSGNLLWMGIDDEAPQDAMSFAQSDISDGEPVRPDLEQFLLDEMGTLSEDPQEQQNFFRTIKSIFEADEQTFARLIQEMTREGGTEALPLMKQLKMMRSVWEDMMREVERDVRTTTLESLELNVGKTFLYLFDYGDEWRFNVAVESITPDAPDVNYPRITGSAGEAPQQYPAWDDEINLSDGNWDGQDDQH